MADASSHEERDRAAPAEPPLVDVQRLLAFTERLHAVHARIDVATMSAARRSGYQRRLAAAADAGHSDLQKAEAHLERLEADLDRQLKD